MLVALCLSPKVHIERPDVESGPQKTRLHARLNHLNFRDLSPSKSQFISLESLLPDPNFLRVEHKNRTPKTMPNIYNLLVSRERSSEFRGKYTFPPKGRDQNRLSANEAYGQRRFTSIRLWRGYFRQTRQRRLPANRCTHSEARFSKPARGFEWLNLRSPNCQRNVRETVWLRDLW
jgi:hypothetical protein